MRAAAPLLAILCACATAPAPAPQAAYAPTPATEQSLREAFPAGSELRFKLEPAGGPVMYSITRFVTVSEEGAMMEDETLDASEKRTDGPKQEKATWKELVAHGQFPADKTTITEVEHEGPLGKHTCSLYVVQAADEQGKPITRKLWFAKDLIGPPVQFETWQGDALLMRATMVTRRKGP